MGFVVISCYKFGKIIFSVIINVNRFSAPPPPPPTAPGTPGGSTVGPITGQNGRVTWRAIFTAPTTGGAPRGYDARYNNAIGGITSWITVSHSGPPVWNFLDHPSSTNFIGRGAVLWVEVRAWVEDSPDPIFSPAKRLSAPS